MVEGPLHKKLKQLAKQVLRRMEAMSIEEEYKCLIDGRRYVVDTVGFCSDKAVAIECGKTSVKKIEALKRCFDKVIVLTVFDLVDYLESNIQDLEKALYEERTKPVTQQAVIAVSRLFGARNPGKTQVPKEVREALELNDGDRILWFSQGGRIYVEKHVPIR